MTASGIPQSRAKNRDRWSRATAQREATCLNPTSIRIPQDPYRGGTRTHTPRRAPGWKPGASANSATRVIRLLPTLFKFRSAAFWARRKGIRVIVQCHGGTTFNTHIRAFARFFACPWHLATPTSARFLSRVQPADTARLTPVSLCAVYACNPRGPEYASTFRNRRAITLTGPKHRT